ncbi:hypothetical protein ACFOLJ_20470 [Rugamonas sp. CCM 8940]|uniref:hypothetical protein n=1 Tax=Rugamonas sp. CCM 8940 TaxID=2765359 RepID=UPI0018F670D4|nr:hypothetical protein [Rugamonas sp. CCM 8940]MBJ7309045.1 hypothetical protein [Rugamonas sp. CCM 8940]
MSIAVSVVVRPSACLRLSHTAVCVCVMAASALCPAWSWAAVCLLGGAVGLLLPPRQPMLSRLDISAVGQIRLTVYQQTGAFSVAEPVVLLAGSTLWPGLLLLRLRHADGRVTTLAVAPGARLRGLVVACRAIAARGVEQ